MNNIKKSKGSQVILQEDDCFSIRPGIIFYKENGKHFFIDKVTFNSGELTCTAYHILTQLNGHTQLKSILASIYSNFKTKTPLSRVSVEVKSFIRNLLEQKIILPGPLSSVAKKYWHGEDLFDGFGFASPGLIYWEVTRKCNLQCRFCYNTLSGKCKRLELSFEQGVNLIAKLKKAGVTSIIFTGGEPLTIEDKVLGWINAANQHGIHTELFTNGTLMTEITIKKLRNVGLNYCRVSLHHSEPEHHDYLTQKKGSWEAGMRALKMLIDNDISCASMITVGSYNIDILRDYLENAIGLGCHGFINGPLCKMGSGKQLSEYCLSPRDYLRLIKFNEESAVIYGDQINITWGADIGMDKEWKDHVIEPIIDDAFFATDVPGFQDVYMRYAKNSICGTGVRSMALSAEGFYIPCPTTGDIILGDALKDDVLDIWRNSKLNVFRKKTIDDFDECGNCGFRYGCAGGCRANAYHNTNSLTGCDLPYKEAHDWLAENSFDSVPSFYQPHEINDKKISTRKGKLEWGANTEGKGPWVPYMVTRLRAMNQA